jgi:ubiquinone/menaquinone biosynthesis C-methylase UbiE
VTLRAAWEGEAKDWLRFCGEPDVFAWRFNIPAFLELLPLPGRLTVDVGCGEGRLGRELTTRGHSVVGIDGSTTLVEAARSGDPPLDAREADAAALPLPDESADLVVSFMALQSVDDLEAAIHEASRVLVPGGHLAFAVVHPMNSVEQAPDYFTEHAYAYAHEREGIEFTFHDAHRPLSAYFAAMRQAGLVTEDLREPVPGQDLIAVHPPAERWTRTPCFMHVLATKP